MSYFNFTGLLVTHLPPIIRDSSAGTYREKPYFLAWAFGSKSCNSEFALIFKLYFFQIVRNHL